MTDTIRDITGIEELPPLPPTPPWPTWLVLAVAGSTLLLLATWIVRRFLRRPALPLPPDRWALVELDRLEALTLFEVSATEHFHTLLSDVVRRYVELRFDLHASRQTTAEFLELARRSPRVALPQQKLLGELFARCDLAKFAPVTPSQEDCRRVTEMARELVTNCNS